MGEGGRSRSWSSSSRSSCGMVVRVELSLRSRGWRLMGRELRLGFSELSWPPPRLSMGPERWARPEAARARSAEGVDPGKGSGWSTAGEMKSPSSCSETSQIESSDRKGTELDRSLTIPGSLRLLPCWRPHPRFAARRQKGATPMSWPPRLRGKGCLLIDANFLDAL